MAKEKKKTKKTIAQAMYIELQPRDLNKDKKKVFQDMWPSIAPDSVAG